MQYKKFLPFAIFLIVAGFLWKGLLLHPNLNANISPNVVKFAKDKVFEFPSFNLTTIEDETKTINRDIFFNKISLVTIWHSECSACAQEHQFFIDLQASNLKNITKVNDKFSLGNVQFIGINFTDPKDKAENFLASYGNPYSINILDKNGSLAVSLGVLGTPETYIVDNNGNIRLKFVGTITLDVWKNQVLPELKLLLDNT